MADPHVVSVLIDQELLGRIDRAADQRGLSRSEFLRDAAQLAAGLVERPEIGERVRELVREEEVTA